MITVPVHDYKSEDELKFIESLSTLDQQQRVDPNLNTVAYVNMSLILMVRFSVHYSYL